MRRLIGGFVLGSALAAVGANAQSPALCEDRLAQMSQYAMLLHQSRQQAEAALAEVRAQLAARTVKTEHKTDQK